MEFSEDVKNRMKRIEGQTRGVLRMMDDEKECKEVINQLSAIRTAVDRVTALIVSRNLEHHVKEQVLKGEKSADNEDLVKQAIELLVKSR